MYQCRRHVMHDSLRQTCNQQESTSHSCLLGVTRTVHKKTPNISIRAESKQACCKAEYCQTMLASSLAKIESTRILIH